MGFCRQGVGWAFSAVLLHWVLAWDTIRRAIFEFCTLCVKECGVRLPELVIDVMCKG